MSMTFFCNLAYNLVVLSNDMSMTYLTKNINMSMTYLTKKKKKKKKNPVLI